MQNDRLEEILVKLKDLETEIQSLKEPENLTYKGFKVRRAEKKFVVTINGKNLFSENSLNDMHYRIDEFYRRGVWIGAEDKVCVWHNWVFVWKHNTLDAYHLEHTVFCLPSDILPDIVKDLKV